MRQALAERRELIEQCADVVLDIALDAKAPWTKPLGVPPRDPRKPAPRWRHARTVAAYRDRYGISDDTTLGPGPEITAQKIDAGRARTVLGRVQAIARRRPPDAAPRPAVEREHVSGRTCDA